MSFRHEDLVLKCNLNCTCVPLSALVLFTFEQVAGVTTMTMIFSPPRGFVCLLLT